MSAVDSPSTDPELLERLDEGFSGFVPHNRALGMHFVAWGEGVAALRLPWAPHLVGNSETGVLHGGAITALLDACGGASVIARTQSPVPIATLDLRIDYLKPATPERDVIAKATCFKIGRNVAFVRAVAYHDDENDPIAAAAGAFMIGTKGAPAVRSAGAAG